MAILLWRTRKVFAGLLLVFQLYRSEAGTFIAVHTVAIPEYHPSAMLDNVLTFFCSVHILLGKVRPK